MTEDGRLLLDGTRIIIQILVDEFVDKLTKETKDEIQKWYDRCYNIETSNSRAPSCARKKVGSRLVAIQGVWPSAEEYLGPRRAPAPAPPAPALNGRALKAEKTDRHLSSAPADTGTDAL